MRKSDGTSPRSRLIERTFSVPKVEAGEQWIQTGVYPTSITIAGGCAGNDAVGSVALRSVSEGERGREVAQFHFTFDIRQSDSFLQTKDRLSAAAEKLKIETRIAAQGENYVEVHLTFPDQPVTWF
jgi:hypothetical protein